MRTPSMSASTSTRGLWCGVWCVVWCVVLYEVGEREGGRKERTEGERTSRCELNGEDKINDTGL